MLSKRVSRRNHVLLLMTLVVVVLALPFHPAAAQDEERIVCDSTLVAQVLVAELDLGYIPPEEIARLDFGQFTPIQEEIQARMQELSAEEVTQAEANMAEMVELMEMMDTMETPADVTVLQVVSLADEHEFCNILRTNLEAFLYLHLALELNMIEG